MASLQYAGKKKLPKTYTINHLGSSYTLDFQKHADIVEVPDAVAEFILKHNPAGFVNIVTAPKPVKYVIPDSEIRDKEIEAEEEASPKPGNLVCEVCGKEYRSNNINWFNKHVESCKEQIKDRKYTVNVLGSKNVPDSEQTKTDDKKEEK